MTTTIVPASGQGILFAQQGPGSTPGYSALDDRRSNSGSLQEGAYGTSTLVTAGGVSNVGQADFMVTQRGSGANMSVDVNMPAGGFAYVQGDTINGQGLYTVPVHSANINEAIAAADATNPRVDQIILEVQDNVLDASGGNLARTRVLTGTPTASASLTNRFGAAALPGSALLLADVLVPAASSSVPNSNIRDRRKWARGARVRILRTAANYTANSTTQTAVDTANLAPRLECSGAPVKVNLQAFASLSTADFVLTGLFVDGAVPSGMASPNDLSATNQAAGGNAPRGYQFETIPAAGSHTFQPTVRTTNAAATLALLANTTTPLIFSVEEVIKQETANNTVTTG